MTLQRCLTLLLSLALLLGTSVLHAASEAGRVLFARGTISIVDAQDAARGARTGSIFYEGERVITGSNSLVQLRMTDGALTALRSNSTYHIERQRYDEQAGIYEQAGRLVSGWMRSITGAIGAKHPNNVRQSTAVATIGIRGTVYQIIHVPPEGLAEFPELAEGSYLFLEEGQIEVSNGFGSRMVQPGQIIHITDNTAPALAPELEQVFTTASATASTTSGSRQTDSYTVRDLDEEQQQSSGVDTSESIARTADQTACVVQGREDCDFNPNPEEPVDPVDPVDPEEPVNPVGQELPMGTLLRSMQKDPLGGTESYVFSIAGHATGTSLVDGDEGDRYLLARSPQYTFIGDTDTGMDSRGSHQLSNGQWVNWGRWLPGTFTAQLSEGYSLVAETDLHYIITDHLLSMSEPLASAPSGAFDYNYVGGTPLTALDGSSISLENGRLSIDFSQSLLVAELRFSNQWYLTGQTTWDGAGVDFGSGLSGSYQGASLLGRLYGAFAGENLEGLLATLEVSGDGLVYNGVGLFEQGDAFVALGNVGILMAQNGKTPQAWENHPGLFADSGSPHQGLVRLWNTPASYFFTLPQEEIQDRGGHVLKEGADDALAVSWGRWASGNYTTFGEATPDGDLHYILSEQLHSHTDASALNDLGMAGAIEYRYVGGTSLTHHNGSEDNIAIDSQGSRLVLDFTNSRTLAEFLFGNGWQVSGSNDWNENPLLVALSGSGTDGALSGEFSGYLIGNADAIAGHLQVSSSDQHYSGVGLFEKGDEQPPEAPEPAVVFSTFMSGQGDDAYPAHGVTWEKINASEFASDGTNQYPLSVALDNDFQSLEGEGTPYESDGLTLADGTHVYWGTWLKDSFTLTDSGDSAPVAAGDWHYILASHRFDLDQPSGPSGIYRYAYRGGSTFTGWTQESGTWQAVSGPTLNSGSVIVDLGNMENPDGVRVDLAFSGFAGTNTNGRIRGSGSLQGGLYGDGIYLNNADESVMGRFAGGLVGSQADGLIASINLDERLFNGQQEEQTFYYGGTAAFEKTSDVLRYGGVSALFVSGSDWSAPLQANHLDTDSILVDAPQNPAPTSVYGGMAGAEALAEESPEYTDDGEVNGVTVYWGYWAPESYGFSFNEVNPDATVPDHEWHYILSNESLSMTDIESLGLSGRFRYDYTNKGIFTGRTSNNGSWEAINGPSLQGGAIAVDFGKLGTSDGDAVEVSLSFGNMAGGSEGEVSGAGSFYALYQGDLSLSNNSESVTGNLIGNFAGAGADALLTGITLKETVLAGEYVYAGSALFGKGLEIPLYGGVGIFANGTSPQVFMGTSDAVRLQPVALGGYYASEMPTDSADLFAGLGNQPMEGSTGEAAVGDAEIYWGIWEAGSYSFMEPGNSPASASTDWHYMVASNVMSLDTVSSLTGEFKYSYTEGTALTSYDSHSLGSTLSLNGSSVTVNFATANLDVDLQVTGSLLTASLTGTGNIGTLYQQGIVLQDDSGGQAEGLMNGMFAGTNAEALLTNISIHHNTENFHGTALFGDREVITPPVAAD